jgi:hypothetical protein
MPRIRRGPCSNLDFPGETAWDVGEGSPGSRKPGTVLTRARLLLGQGVHARVFWGPHFKYQRTC